MKCAIGCTECNLSGLGPTIFEYGIQPIYSHISNQNWSQPIDPSALILVSHHTIAIFYISIDSDVVFSGKTGIAANICFPRFSCPWLFLVVWFLLVRFICDFQAKSACAWARKESQLCRLSPPVKVNTFYLLSSCIALFFSLIYIATHAWSVI